MFDIIGKVILIAIICIRVVNDSKKAWVLLWIMVVSQGYNAFRINEQYFLDGYSLYAFRDWDLRETIICTPFSPFQRLVALLH